MNGNAKMLERLKKTGIGTGVYIPRRFFAKILFQALFGCKKSTFMKKITYVEEKNEKKCEINEGIWKNPIDKSLQKWYHIYKYRYFCTIRQFLGASKGQTSLAAEQTLTNLDR